METVPYTNDFKPNLQGSKIKRILGKTLLTLWGWKIVGNFQSEDKQLVITGAPHTTNWDLPLVICMALATGIQIKWVGKKSLFNPFTGWLFRLLGGVPVDRSSRQGFVEQMAQQYEQNDTFYLGIMPEGTRKYAEFWKTGFYHIARKAEVPVKMAFFDYGRGVCGFGDTVHLTGNLEDDLVKFKEFYQHMIPKYPKKFGPIQWRPDNSELNQNKKN